MKKTKSAIAFTLMLSLITISTWALSPEDVPPGSNIQFESWCEGDSIKTIDPDGNEYTSFDCYDANLRCTEDSQKHADWVIVTATCS